MSVKYQMLNSFLFNSNSIKNISIPIQFKIFQFEFRFNSISFNSSSIHFVQNLSIPIPLQFRNWIGIELINSSSFWIDPSGPALPVSNKHNKLIFRTTIFKIHTLYSYCLWHSHMWLCFWSFHMNNHYSDYDEKTIVYRQWLWFTKTHFIHNYQLTA